MLMEFCFYRIDVNSAFILDRAPRFPIPYDILPSLHIVPLSSVPDRSLMDSCVTKDFSLAISEFLNLVHYMERELAVRDLWDDGVFAGLHVVPLLARLLSVRHDSVEDDPALAREEACRTAVLMYLGSIRRNFGVQITPEIFIPKLKQSIVFMDKSTPEEMQNVLLWLLLIGGVQSIDHEDHGFFIGAISGAMIRLKCGTWDELMTAARAISWVDGILEPECTKLHVEVSSELWHTYGHFIT